MPSETTSQKAARTAALAVDVALAAMREHPDAQRLWRPALRRAVAAIAGATALVPLVLRLHDGAVQVGDEPVLHFQPDEVPFGALRSIGIGELQVAPQTPTAVTERLIVRLASMQGGEATEHELHTLLASEELPGVSLRAAADAADRPADDHEAWAALPPAGLGSPALRALIQRDQSANLPALAARQLLDDCELLDARHDGVLERLMARILGADDVATASWLLAEAQRQPAFDRDVAIRLHAMARTRCDDDWLQQRLERSTHDELLQLSALIMQLGDDTAERFAAAAAAVAHPLSQWLAELLGRPRS